MNHEIGKETILNVTVQFIDFYRLAKLQNDNLQNLHRRIKVAVKLRNTNSTF